MIYYLVNSLGWFGLGVYIQRTWEYFVEEGPRARTTKTSKPVVER